MSYIYKNRPLVQAFLRGLLIFLSAGLFLTSCGGNDKNKTTSESETEVVVEKASVNDVSKEMQLNKEKWLSHEITDYSVEIQKICFCEPDTVRMMIFDIDDNQISSVRYADTGEDVSPTLYNNESTVMGMFQLVENSIKQNPEEILISYDKKYGYIKQLTIDYKQNIADDEFTIIASSLKPEN